jgi:hypothetical protein
MKILAWFLFAAFVSCVCVGSALAQGTAFTYQGQLSSTSGPANGLYDFQFGVFDSASGSAQIGSTIVTNGIAVSNGLFTITLDFGANVFTGNARWLDLAARTNQSPNAFTSMTPRQPLTPAPYAVLAGGLNPSAQVNIAGLMIQQNSAGAPNLIEGSSLNFVAGGVVGATISGGGAVNYNGSSYSNSVRGNFGTVSGGYANQAINFGDFVGGGGLDEPAGNVAQGGNSVVVGGSANVAGGFESFVGGGYGNGASGNGAFVGGGGSNVGGNHAAGDASVVVGGEFNTAGGTGSFVGGGGYDGNFLTANGNSASGGASVIAGGLGNSASGNESAIGGGVNNHATNSSATVPGGRNNIAGGQYSFAAGNGAQAVNDGTFVWADSQAPVFASTANDQFLIRAQGGVGINMNNPGGASFYAQGNRTGGWQNSVGWFENTNRSASAAPALRIVCDGGTNLDGALSVSSNGKGLIAEFGNAANFVVTITNDGTIYSKGLALTSDRNAKENFTLLNPKAVLAKVVSLPVTQWNYKDDAADKKHIGPVAQDFYAAFGLDGVDDKHISVVDEGGVALAAVQGLNEKLEDKDAVIQKQGAEISELKARLAALEKMVLSRK